LGVKETPEQYIDSRMRQDKYNLLIAQLMMMRVDSLDASPAPTNERELFVLELLKTEAEELVARIESLILDAPSFVEECPACPGEEGYMEEIA
jgi:hypothetical protein